MGRLQFGGGTPTILSPALIAQIMAKVDAVLDRAQAFELSGEIVPTLVTRAQFDAFAKAGMNRASIGVQDFDPKVQAAIGREQSFETTQSCVNHLRDAGIGSINVDLVYGLPHQTSTTFARTLLSTLDLQPDRLSLFGYAHVPHMARRQRLIPEECLPGDRARFGLFGQARKMFQAAGYQPMGIDHFALPKDSLLAASRNGELRRNFQGYTDDACPTLLGFGASSISRVGGYFQNASATADYARQVNAETIPIARQHLWTDDDQLRGRVIEMLLCDHRINLPKLREEFGSLGALQVEVLACAARFGTVVQADETGLRMAPGSEPLVRAIALFFDAYKQEKAIYSRVS
jgi:oxygen-independent coproporphyrinogen-3 oxidase